METSQYTISDVPIDVLWFGGVPVVREPTTTHQVRKDCPWIGLGVI